VWRLVRKFIRFCVVSDSSDQRKIIIVANDPSKISNVRLVKRCAENPNDEQAWTTFVARFGEHIKRMILREGKRKNIRGFEESFKDLVSEVYLKLVKDDCRALKVFHGNSENSIYTYLAVIARNVVKGEHTRESAQRRPRIVKSIDEPASQSLEDGEITIADRLASDDSADAELNEGLRHQQIDRMLDEVLKGRNKERDKLIFKLAVLDEFTAEQIAASCGEGISVKRIENRNKEIKTLISKKFPRHDLRGL
jgi:RNA polymerase sigma factor (sigma-70 family)